MLLAIHCDLRDVDVVVVYYWAVHVHVDVLQVVDYYLLLLVLAEIATIGLARWPAAVCIRRRPAALGLPPLIRLRFGVRVTLVARRHPFVLPVHLGLESGSRPALLLDDRSFFIDNQRVIPTMLKLMLLLICAVTLIHLRHLVRRLLARGLLALLAIGVGFCSDDWLVSAILLPAALS